MQSVGRGFLFLVTVAEMISNPKIRLLLIFIHMCSDYNTV